MCIQLHVLQCYVPQPHGPLPARAAQRPPFGGRAEAELDRVRREATERARDVREVLEDGPGVQEIEGMWYTTWRGAAVIADSSSYCASVSSDVERQGCCSTC